MEPAVAKLPFVRLPAAKLSAALLGALLLSGCAPGPSGEVVQTQVSAQGVTSREVLSRYFEARADLAEPGLHAHLIATLGKERLPKGAGLSISAHDRMFNAAIEEVLEIYFTNTSDEPIVVEDVRLSFFNTWMPFAEAPASIAPGEFHKTVPVAFISSAYRAPRKRVLSLTVNGVPHELPLQERRTPLSEVPR